MTMPSEMTDGYHERTRLLGFRMVFVSIGQLLAAAGTGEMIRRGGGGAQGYAAMGLVMSLMIFGAMTAAFFGMAKPRMIERSLAPARLPGGQLALCQNIVTFLSLPMWVRLGRVIGKRRTYRIGVALFVVGALSWLSAEPGLQREGMLSGIIAVIEKTAFAVGAAIVGGMLTIANDVPTVGGALVEQPDSAVRARYLGFAVIPALIFCGNALRVYFYDLDERKLHDEPV